jgi:HAD superfamily hydrolase (TIGR01484 family)
MGHRARRPSLSPLVTPLSSLSRDRARSLLGLLFDLDDTLLTHGVLTRDAYGALWDLHDAGLRLVAVTGRPSGWGEIIVRQWPIDGAVTENGAVRVRREGSRLLVCEACSNEERASRQAKLAELVVRIAGIVPEAKLTDDVDARRSDVTWDINEKEHLPVERVELIAAEILRAGARTTRSSVHIHATFDADDKASGAVAFLAAAFGEDAGRAVQRYGFVGDSGNDAPCFGAFKATFGVANVQSALGRLVVPPQFVASRPMGAGFAEVAKTLLSLRQTV